MTVGFEIDRRSGGEASGARGIDVAALEADLRRLAAGIARFCAGALERDGRLGAREYYAHAFAVWPFAQLGVSFDAPRRAALERMRKNGSRVDPSLPTKFHWEFVRFALQKAAAHGGLATYGSVAEILGGERFAYTRVANWTMLRAAVRLGSPNPLQRLLSYVERGAALAIFQLPGGFIEDTRGSPTAQYHAFSTAMLGLQVFELSLARRLHLGRFRRAVAALRHITFSDGEMNVLGRGQCQSFGYAAAALALVLAAIVLGESEALVDVRRVLDRLAAAQRDDGSVPLVLRDEGDCVHEIVDVASPKYIGWYRYNNYFDYLAFTGALAALAADLIRRRGGATTAPVPAARHPAEAGVDDRMLDGIRMVRTARYEALLRPPGRVLSDGMALPFLSVGGRHPMPCYGGEPAGVTLFRREDLPLPRLVAPDGAVQTLFEPAAYRWSDGETFVGHGEGWTLRRRVVCSAEGIAVTDGLTLDPRHAGRRADLVRFLLSSGSFEQRDERTFVVGPLLLKTSHPVTAEAEPRWSALGPLVAFSAAVTVGPEGVSDATGSLTLTVRKDA